MSFRTLRYSLAALAAVAFAVETKTWTQSEAAEFERGTLQDLALSSDGRVSLGPVWKELYDAAIPQLWSVAAGPGGTLYAGGGDGKVFTLDAAGKGRPLATLEGGGAVYALTTGAKGEIYAASSPDAKIWRIAADGKASLLATLKAHYVWALVPAKDGALFAATGDPGQIQRIAADGKTTVVYDAEETHVRSLAAAPNGDWIAGTEPGGFVVRVNPRGEGFVLYQTARREVTALVVAPNGTVYAAAVGTRGAPQPQPVAPPPAAVPAQQPAQVAGGAPGQAQVAVRPAAAPAPVPVTIGAAPPSGGSEIYRIGPDGEPKRLWTNSTLTVQALALDREGRLIAGTGNTGRIYHIDSELVSTRLVSAEPSHVTAFAPAPGGGLYAATANPAKIFRLGPETAASGTLSSDILDSGAFTYWGRLRWEGEANGGQILLEARSGNMDKAGKSWSPWSAVDPAAGGRVAAPPARFLAWRATLKAAPNSASPVLRLVEAAYQAKNGPPQIEKIEITPANYRFPAASASLTAGRTLSLPAIGTPRRTAPAAASDTGGAVSMSHEKGWLGARWKAADPNADTLTYKVEYRGAEEKEWKPLKDSLTEARYSWDSTAWADGRYRLRVTASDETDNYPGMTLTAQMESDEFLVDNTPPEITGLSAAVQGAKIALKFTAADALSSLESAEYSLNGGAWVAVPPSTRITDSPQHDYAVEMDKPAGTEFTIAVRVADERENTVVKKAAVR